MWEKIKLAALVVRDLIRSLTGKAGGGGARQYYKQKDSWRNRR